VNHRHLLPNEIDLLVDGEAGFGVAPLRAHVAECDECRARLDDARIVVDALEDLPHFAPDSRLADRVMAQVPVFVPAHVAARDSVTRWLPQSGPARAAAAIVGTSIAGLLTVAMVWLASRGDAAIFATSLFADRVQSLVMGTARDLAFSLLGESAVSAIQASGMLGVTLLVLGFLGTAVGTILGLRRLATASSRRG
jgi:anti-sigma factor RsiW